MFMAVYSFLLALALGLSAPWWLWRMASSGRYREGLGERLGFVPDSFRAAVAGKKTIWIHAVSVGEVLAVERLVAELRTALPGFVIAVSTTTATGQKIARERFAGAPVFYFPLDFAFAVRAWLRVLRPSLMVLVESEFWPRHLAECERAGVPVAVVNARVSDRSFPRYMRLRWLWRRVFAKVRLFLAQGEESAERLRAIGAEPERVVVSGNLKYDMQPNENTSMIRTLRPLLARRRLIVAGSLLEGEEACFLSDWCWWNVRSKVPEAILLLAPRHPDRFERVAAMSGPGMTFYKASDLVSQENSGNPLKRLKPLAVIVLNTIGDLAAVYGLADVAVIGGSFFGNGGHNPLEAARQGVPVIMGPSYQNFREIVDEMRKMDAIRICHKDELEKALRELLLDDGGMGDRGRHFYQTQAGATRRAGGALVTLIPEIQRSSKPTSGGDGTAEAVPLSGAGLVPHRSDEDSQ